MSWLLIKAARCRQRLKPESSWWLCGTALSGALPDTFSWRGWL